MLVQMICEFCGREHEGKYASGRFCNEKCARSFPSKNNKINIYKKISTSLKKNAKINPNYGFKGKHFSEESLKKLSDSHKKAAEEKYKKVVETHSFEELPKKYKIRFLFKENGNNCQECGFKYTDEKTGKGPYEIHHLDGNNNNWIKENLKILCLICHWKTKNYRFRNGVHKKESILKFTKSRLAKMEYKIVDVDTNKILSYHHNIHNAENKLKKYSNLNVKIEKK